MADAVGKVIEGDRPSAYGADLGRALATMADFGKAEAPDLTMCATCAFREGSAPNMTAGTGLTALKCVMGIDNDGFGCHHGLADGQPTRLCAGYEWARQAPWSLVQAAVIALQTDMARWGDEDAVRADFDAWLSGADPLGKWDVYQAAREFAKRAPSPSQEDSHDDV